MEKFELDKLKLNKYVFFTGKGGVGKTSIACATSVALADKNKKVLLISTDPASNLEDIFDKKIDNKGTLVKEVPNLKLINLDPIEAANEYKESVIAPYEGKLPQSLIENMQEQLSGSCTVEIAAFNEFSKFITDPKAREEYDHIIFDTAPTGHTLRMLKLPSAWNNFISQSKHGASCLGQLSGLQDKKDIYKLAVDTLSDSNQTSLILVARAQEGPLKEASRAYRELKELGIDNQKLIINALLTSYDDELSKKFFDKEKKALENIDDDLKKLDTFMIPLRSYNVSGIDKVRLLLKEDKSDDEKDTEKITKSKDLEDIVNDLYENNKKIIFTMGKGGVGKTTMASAIAVALSKKGEKVHLTTTDPAHHVEDIVKENDRLSISYIDEDLELKKYQKEVLDQAQKTMSEDDLEYIKEDLRSPCTQEIAVFRAFAEVVDKNKDKIVVIDTAPTGHTLLLLDSTQSYNKEIEKSQGEVPESSKKLLPRLKDKGQTEVVIVTLAETTPVYESLRLEEDLNRAGIFNKWWIINQSLQNIDTGNKVLISKSKSERKWINKVNDHSKNMMALVSWKADEIKNLKLEELI